MTYANLRQYTASKNSLRALFKKSPFPAPTELTTSDADEIFRSLGGDLSPENLCCDGELPRAQVVRRKRLYDGAVAELRALGFTPPRDAYID